MNPYSPDLMVDQVIGSAYQIVKYVAANMEMLIDLSAKIPVLESYMDEINSVLANITNINTVATNITSVNTVAANIGVVNTVSTNITALLAIYANLSAILAVPDAIAAQDWKNSVVVATTANITLSGSQTIDGVAVVAGNRVLVKSQTTGSQNGIYVVAAGAWTRAADAVSPNVSTNNVVMAERGTVNAGKLFRLSTVGNIVVGTTVQSWTDFTPSASTTVLGMARMATAGEFDSGTGGVVVTPDQVLALEVASNGDGISLVMPKTGQTFNVKSILAGDNITLVDNGEGTITISAIGGGGGIANVGDVIDAILTDANGILFDSEGNILYEVTI